MKLTLKSTLMLAAAVLGLAATAHAQSSDQTYLSGAIPKLTLDAMGDTPPVTTIAACNGTQNLALPTFYNAAANAQLPAGPAAYDVTMTGSCTLTFSGWYPGYHQIIWLRLRQDATGGRVVTLPSGLKWSNNQALTFATAANAVVDLRITSTDGGATIVAAGQ